MSLFDSIKERGKSIFEKVADRVKESGTYAQAMDRYESMSPTGQQWARIGAGTLLLILILFIPATNFLSSNNTLTTYEENRNLIRDLFKTYRESNSSQNIPVPPGPDMLRSSIQTLIQQADLLPEQNLGVIEAASDGKLIPKNLVSNVLAVSLGKLNLKQIVDFGASLVGISESIKMRDISIVANAKDTRYYDVTYTLYTLKVPEPTPEAPPEVEIKAPKKSSGSSKDKNNAKGSDE